jgi:hypothetical protein
MTPLRGAGHQARRQESDRVLTHKHQARPLPNVRQPRGCEHFYRIEKLELSTVRKKPIVFPHRCDAPVTGR